MSRELPRRLWRFARQSSWRFGLAHPFQLHAAWRYYSRFVYMTDADLASRRAALARMRGAA